MELAVLPAEERPRKEFSEDLRPGSKIKLSKSGFCLALLYKKLRPKTYNFHVHRNNVKFGRGLGRHIQLNNSGVACLKGMCCFCSSKKGFHGCGFLSYTGKMGTNGLPIQKKIVGFFRINPFCRLERDQACLSVEMVGPYEFFACNYHVTIAWIVCNHFFWHVCI
jgi:hypothetical protein